MHHRASLYGVAINSYKLLYLCFFNGKTKLNQKVCRKLYSFENFHIKTGYLRKLHTKKIDSVSKYPLTGHHVSDQAKLFEWNSTTKLSLRHMVCVYAYGCINFMRFWYRCQASSYVVFDIRSFIHSLKTQSNSFEMV